MKKVVFIKRANHAPVIADAADSRYLVELNKGFQGRRVSWPNSLQDVNYAESHINAKGLTEICYVDLPMGDIAKINNDFEVVFLDMTKVLFRCLKEMGLESAEIPDNWRSFGGKHELKAWDEAFGEWKILQSPFDFLDEANNLDASRIENAFVEWCKVEYGGLLRKLKDSLLLLRNYSDLERFAVHLNRFEVFPTDYFRKVCKEHSWGISGLGYGEMCSDGAKVLVMGEDGKCHVAEKTF